MAASDAFYNEVLVDVNAVIDELGTTYNVRGTATYDPTTLSTTVGASREVAGLVADQSFQSVVSGLTGTADDVRGGWQGRKNLLLKADAAPAPGEEVQVEGEWFPLDKVEPIKPADVVVLYILDVSR